MHIIQTNIPDRTFEANVKGKCIGVFKGRVKKAHES